MTEQREWTVKPLEVRIEDLAKWLHSEVEWPEYDFPDHSWPDHPDDDGNRGGGGYVKIIPRSSADLFREIATRILSALIPAEPPVAEDVIDIEEEFFSSMIEAATELKWMPPEYCMNDWVSDVCDFLRNGPVATPPTADLQAEVDRWLPIETAPKDGTYVDLWAVRGECGDVGYRSGERYADCRFVRRTFGTEPYGDPVWTGLNDRYIKITPTHWMPIPKGPRAALGDSQ